MKCLFFVTILQTVSIFTAPFMVTAYYRDSVNWKKAKSFNFLTDDSFSIGKIALDIKSEIEKIENMHFGALPLSKNFTGLGNYSFGVPGSKAGQFFDLTDNALQNQILANTGTNKGSQQNPQYSDVIYIW